ncbi:MAG: hypothetical protein QM528_02800, partial [Phycisphaerales bacterium]|nr:hypothetical protein [Phycisphaerales bacterium]
FFTLKFTFYRLTPHKINLTQEILNSIEQKKLNKYKSQDRPKALIHSWLAWQEAPGAPMGLAIKKKYLTNQDETCNKLIAWLKDTFSPM